MAIQIQRPLQFGRVITLNAHSGVILGYDSRQYFFHAYECIDDYTHLKIGTKVSFQRDLDHKITRVAEKVKIEQSLSMSLKVAAVNTVTAK